MEDPIQTNQPYSRLRNLSQEYILWCPSHAGSDDDDGLE